MNELYFKFVHQDIDSIFGDWCKNNGVPLLRTVWHNNLEFDQKQNKWKSDRKLVGFDASWACYVEGIDKTGWHNMKFDWERDSKWMTIFNCSHFEYHRLITLKEGTPIIVVFPDKKEAYKATFKKHAMRYGYGHYVDVTLENGEERELHCLTYEGEWICFPAE